MNPDIAERIAEIRGDRAHGASWLLREAVGAMQLTIKRSEAKTVADFLEELKLVAAELIKARPSMAAITNCVSRLVGQVFEESRHQKDLEPLKSFALSSAVEIIHHSEEAILRAAEQAATLVTDRDRLMTCSYSATMCLALRIAREGGKRIHIIIAESRSGGRAYGESTAQELKSDGISVVLIPDNAIRHYMTGVNKALVGADSVLSDGSLINGTPTYAVASATGESTIPFYSVCETAKFNAQGGPQELEEGFERIPPDLITGIATEEGIIRPGEVTGYGKRWGASPPLTTNLT
jgi:translation initiation factor 2B subunit (eIF-2B alpha/beta/delta family)